MTIYISSPYFLFYSGNSGDGILHFLIVIAIAVFSILIVGTKLRTFISVSLSFQQIYCVYITYVVGNGWKYREY